MVVQHDTVKVVATDSWELFLMNPSDNAVELRPCELFGFSTGTFTDKPIGLDQVSFQIASSSF